MIIQLSFVEAKAEQIDLHNQVYVIGVIFRALFTLHRARELGGRGLS